MKTEYSREELLELIERAWVHESKWSDRDSAEAQKQLGLGYALLRAGCAFKMGSGTCTTDHRTVWIDIFAKGFAYRDYDGPLDEETCYIPTAARLAENLGTDWY